MSSPLSVRRLKPISNPCSDGWDAPTLTDTIVGADGRLRPVMERVALVSPSDVPVLILGETGSGKEVIARAIHMRSARAAGPFIRVNCGAIPPDLIDSELFGHEKGSFTGAVGTRRGWFERADEGTLFWMRSENCRWPLRCGCYAWCRKGYLNAWAANTRSR